MIYLDSAAFSKPLECAFKAYRNAPFGNPSSEHAVGKTARDALEKARDVVAECIDADPSEVYFCSTATEAAAWVIRGLEIGAWQVIPSNIEHHAISENAEKYNNSPHMAYARMLCNNETGEIFDAPPNRGDALWVCDATAAVGHIPVSFRELGADVLIADGVKFGGVPGAALLVAKKDFPLIPLIRGGGQERGMRGGTENVPAICAMAAALERQTEHMEENALKIGAMRQIFVQSLSKIPDHKWNTPFEKPCVPHILNISFDGVDGKALGLYLSNQGVMVSTGAACSNGLNEPSHVLMAMYNDEARARSAIRISLSVENTIEECVWACDKIKSAVEFLRSI